MTAPNSAGPAPLQELRRLPKTDLLLTAADRSGVVGRLGRGAVVDAIRDTLERIRKEILAGAPCPPLEAIERSLLERLAESERGSLRPVVNATGVVVHTNLGRAPLSAEAIDAMRRAAEGYTNLELDLTTGERGDRYLHAEAALCRLTGAEGAVVVNNNASAVMLALAALMDGRPSGGQPVPPLPAQRDEQPLSPLHAQRGEGSGEGPARSEVVVSRGQLVEIGGGFRIPDVLRRSGAALVEVGTTNRTYARDFEEALGPRTRILLSVHRSNFALRGFTHDATLAELVALGRANDLWVVDDLGSGSLLETAPFGLGDEPTIPARVAAGADLVCFSGDKLLGGPQAGILAGRGEAIRRVKRHPLVRALRPDKVTLAALSATLAHYERGEATTRIPIWRAIAADPLALRARAEEWRVALGEAGRGCTILESRSAVGGGSLPEVTLPTFVLALPPGSADELAARLRRADPPVVARIEEGRVVLDPRTVMPGEDEAVVRAVKAALGGAATD